MERPSAGVMPNVWSDCVCVACVCVRGCLRWGGRGRESSANRQTHYAEAKTTVFLPLWRLDTSFVFGTSKHPFFSVAFSVVGYVSFACCRCCSFVTIHNPMTKLCRTLL